MKGKEGRQNGLDVLRIVAVIMVVMLHYLYFGGGLNGVEYGTGNYYLMWFLEALAYPAVDIFLIISGYFYDISNNTKKKLVNLWFVLVFYSIFCYIIYNIYGRITGGFAEQNWSWGGGVYKCFLPILTVQYWYFTVYFIFYFLQPYIKVMIDNLEYTQFKRLIVILLTLTLVSTIAPVFEIKLYIQSELFLFTILYIVGAFIKKYSISMKPKKAAAILIFLYLAMWFSKIIAEYLIKRLGLNYGGALLYENQSIVCVSIAVMWLLLLKNFTNLYLGKYISILSANVMAVYIIHNNQNINKILWKILRTEDIFNTKFFLPHMLASVLIIFIICILIELARKMIVRKSRVIRNGKNKIHRQ